ncbi:YopX family protein, partial [Leptospira johnsonii]
GQYTGLKDKNGREIYEGDILSFDGNMTADNSMGLDPNGFMYDESDKYQVIWHPDRAAFDLDYSGLDELPHWKYRRGTWGLMLGGNCEIIGNIYETPELLEK